MSAEYANLKTELEANKMEYDQLVEELQMGSLAPSKTDPGDVNGAENSNNKVECINSLQ